MNNDIGKYTRALTFENFLQEITIEGYKFTIVEVRTTHCLDRGKGRGKREDTSVTNLGRGRTLLCLPRAYKGWYTCMRKMPGPVTFFITTNNFFGLNTNFFFAAAE